MIFAVDAIFPPLTGLGRYAWELARRLENNTDVEEVRFFSMGRWIQSPKDLLPGTDTGMEGSPQTETARAFLRRRLSRHVLAVRGYSAVVPRWMTYRLRRCEGFLYHSPNFFVPKFDGLSIATVHDLSIFRFPETHPKSRRKMFELNMTQTLQRVCHVLTDSESTRREIMEYFGWPEDRVTAIHLGVDPIFSPRQAQTLRQPLAKFDLEAGKYTLCVSTTEPRKRIPSLIDAYKRLPATLRAEYPLVLVGDSGWLNDAIHEQIVKGQREGWLRHLGYVSANDLPNIYSGARAFCYPSVYEGFGLPVLEAMASGVPVLTSDRSSLPEVADGAAHLVDPDDKDALRNGLHRIIEDSGWRTTAVRRGLQIAALRTWERCMVNTIDVYRRVST